MTMPALLTSPSSVVDDQTSASDTGDLLVDPYGTGVHWHLAQAQVPKRGGDTLRVGEVGPGAEYCLGGAFRQLMVFPGRPCSALWLEELARRKERLLEPSRPLQGGPAMAWALPLCLPCLVKR